MRSVWLWFMYNNTTKYIITLTTNNMRRNTKDNIAKVTTELKRSYKPAVVVEAIFLSGQF